MEDKEKTKCDLKSNKNYLKVKSDNVIQIRFDKLTGNDELEKLNDFVLKRKKVYANLKETIIGYTNYFIENYDEENELLYGYLTLKFMIDENKRYSKRKVFISDLYEYLLSDTMVEKIQRMTDDLYEVNLESSTKKKKDYNETLQFDNTHGKILMNISLAIKIAAPIVAHFMYKNQIKKADPFIYKCFKNMYKYFEGDYKINNKLYEMIYSRVLKTSKRDRLMWEQGLIRGKDYEKTTAENFKKLHVDILAKLTYDGNPIHYCIRSMDNAIGNQMREKYMFKYSPVTNAADGDGFTGFEKLEMHTSRFDESSLIQNRINITQTLKKLIKDNKVKITDDMMDFYMENLEISKWQKDLIFQYFAKYFGSTTELRGINKRKFCKLVIILKKMLERRNFKFLQHILTGQVVEKVELKRAQKKKQQMRMTNSSTYTDLMDYEFNSIKNVFGKRNVIDEYKDIILNYKIALVDYKYYEDNGKLINNADANNKDLISDELLRFIKDI